MDGATLNAKIWKGRGIAGNHIGMPCDLYRPVAVAQPFSNHIGRLNAAFNAADSTYLKPNLYGKAIFFADLDGRQTIPGDYLIRMSDGAIYFIAAQQQLLPIVAIACNAKVTVRRQPASRTFGAGPYSGVVDPAYVLGSVDTPWAASILIGGRALAAAGLPADVKESGWRILLPPSVPVTIEAGDRLDDDLGRSFWTESAELTDLGWRLTVNEAHS